METFADNLRRARKLHPDKITQADLGNVLGVSQQAVASWESGRSVPEARRDPATGMDDLAMPDLPAQMFEHQRDIVRWALQRGRAAVFAQTGLGKSFMELAWGHAVHQATGGNVLLLTPLAVAAQMVDEAGKFGMAAKQCATQAEVEPGITRTKLPVESRRLQSLASWVRLRQRTPGLPVYFPANFPSLTQSTPPQAPTSGPRHPAKPLPPTAGTW